MVSRRIRVSCRYQLRRFRRFVVHRVLHADDPPQRLALGVAIGVFVAFTPTFGVQMLLAAFLAWVFRANKVVSAAAVWISNPATILPMYGSAYYVGCWVLRQSPVAREDFKALLHPPEGWLAATRFYWESIWSVAEPMWVGGVLVGLVCAYLMYLFVERTVRWYRLRRFGTLHVSRVLQRR